MRIGVIAGAAILAAAALLAALVAYSINRVGERWVEFEQQTSQVHKGMPMFEVAVLLGPPAERLSGPDMDDSCRAVNAANQVTYVFKRETWVNKVLCVPPPQSRFIICADQNGNVLRTDSMLIEY